MALTLIVKMFVVQAYRGRDQQDPFQVDTGHAMLPVYFCPSGRIVDVNQKLSFKFIFTL